MKFRRKAATAPVARFRRNDYVLYRDPEAFWGGEPGHTFVCRVRDIHPYFNNTLVYTLATMSGGSVSNACGDYMRLLPPADAMADIDTAPLRTDTVPAMTPAAVAWLTQQEATASCYPQLPPYDAGGEHR